MPHLVPCRCDPNWTAMAVCPVCAKAQHDVLLHKRLAHQGAVREAFDALAASYDADDRARDAADMHRMESSA